MLNNVYSGYDCFAVESLSIIYILHTQNALVSTVVLGIMGDKKCNKARDAMYYITYSNT